MKFNRHELEKYIIEEFPEAEFTVSDENEIHFNTPFDNDDKKRLYVNLNSSSWYDQKRQVGGKNFITFLTEYLDTSKEKAFLEYKKRSFTMLGEKVPKKEIIAEEDLKEKDLELPDSKVIAFGEKEDLEKEALKYLQDRKIKTDSLGYVLSGKFANRIIVPFYENEKLVYYIARAFDGNPFRYKNPLNTKAGDFLYNYDKIKDELFIFEGVFDALSLEEQVGTAMLSSVIKEKQVKKVYEKAPNKIIFVTDNDKKTSTRITILENLIKTFTMFQKYKPNSVNCNFYIYRIPEKYKDFNEMKVDTNKSKINIDEYEPFDKGKIIIEIQKLKLISKNTVSNKKKKIKKITEKNVIWNQTLKKLF